MRNVSETAYEKSLELSSRTLTEYILYRDKIISRMKEMTADNAESDIHSLIVRGSRRFSQGSMPSEIYQNNAWLLDDKFMVFRTILSEKRMDTVINAIRLDEESTGDTGRPDIAMIFSADPADTTPVDVVVVEIKKKTDEEKDNFYAVNQLLDRAGKLVKHCPNVKGSGITQLCRLMTLQLFDFDSLSGRLFLKRPGLLSRIRHPHPDGRVVPTPTFVVSFDAIVADAECRNHTFLEILRME